MMLFNDDLSTIDQRILTLALSARHECGLAILQTVEGQTPPLLLKKYRIMSSIEQAFDPLTYALAEAFGWTNCDYRESLSCDEKSYLLTIVQKANTADLFPEEWAGAEEWLFERSMLLPEQDSQSSVTQLRDLANMPHYLIGAARQSQNAAMTRLAH